MKGSLKKIDILRSVELLTEISGSIEDAAVIALAPSQGDVHDYQVFGDEFKKLAKIHDFDGKVDSIENTYLLEGGKTLLSLVGVGNPKEASSAASAIETYYIAGASVAKRVIIRENPSHLAIQILAKEVTVDMITAFLHRMLFVILRSQARIDVPGEPLCSTGKEPKESLKLTKITMIVPGFSDIMIKAIFNTARTLAEASVSVALVTDCPPNVMNCQFIADLIQKQAAQASDKVTCKVLTENECKEMNMGAFLGVAAGSKFGARLIHLTYKNVTNNATPRRIALVGKGITMDTGGYNLKVTDSISYMKCDMAGAATMLFTLLAVAQLEIEDVEVHAIGAFCENMIDQNAYRPGDYLRASNGKTIEITNTDAEGRLALADALIYAEQNVLGGPGCGTIIDAATLTGACLVALGTEVGAIMSNQDELSQKILSCANNAGEAMWQLPLRKRYHKKIEGRQTDLVNASTGSKLGGTITAGLFLEDFVSSETEWAHIDLAGPAWNFEDREATGYGVASLVNFVADRSS